MIWSSLTQYLVVLWWEYNHVPPDEALGMQTPATLWQPRHTGNSNGGLKMRDIGIRMFAFVVTTMVLVLSVSAPASAQGAAEATYKAKCASCHAPDGSGSAVGKKLGTHDFGGAEVQKMSDTELSDITATGKNKMPGYEKTLKADDIKGLVAYIRTLKK
jgi:mono/diheme cytochrome c family protein